MAESYSQRHDDDPFSNFQFEPPKGPGPWRAFTRRNKYRHMASMGREKMTPRLASSSSLASLTGSTQNLLDPAKMMSMQDEARSRRISSEVMKNRLYESVVTSPRKRRFSMRMDYSMPHGDKPDPQAYARMVQSLPVTPAHSQNVSPAHSPTQSRSFMFGFFSRGTTPNCMTPEELDEDENSSEMEVEDESWKGIASLFRPQPRYIPGARYDSCLNQNMDCQSDMQAAGGVGGELLPPSEKPGILLRNVPRMKKRTKSPVNDMDI